MDDFEAASEACLRRHGYRLTRSRRLVIAALAEADRALSPYGIIEHLAAATPVPDVVTVYRVLELLQTLDLAHRVHSAGGYVACTRLSGHGCHHPVICSGCGRIAEIEGDELAPIEHRLAAGGWRITGHVLEFQGLCPRCLSPETGTAAAAAPR
jgi:Fe2+ or Zn2+ uptake regulation protein